MCIISNSNRTEWSPIRSVIIRVMTKSDDREAEVQFVYYEYDNTLSDKRFRDLAKKCTQKEVKNTSITSAAVLYHLSLFMFIGAYLLTVYHYPRKCVSSVQNCENICRHLLIYADACMLMRKSVTDGFVCQRDLRGGSCTQATLLRTARLIEDR